MGSEGIQYGGGEAAEQRRLERMLAESQRKAALEQAEAQAAAARIEAAASSEAEQARIKAEKAALQLRESAAAKEAPEVGVAGEPDLRALLGDRPEFTGLQLQIESPEDDEETSRPQ